MPSFEFDTPEPVLLQLEMPFGNVRLTATERADSTVEVLPASSANERDVQAAAQTRVEFGSGRLLVKAPKQPNFGIFGKPGCIEVSVSLPVGSRVDGDAGAGALRVDGRLGDLNYRTGVGDLEVGDTGAASLITGAGSVHAGHVGGKAEVRTGTGRVQLWAVDGPAVVKTSNGEAWIGEAGSDLRINSANGGIRVDRSCASVAAHTANGDIRLGEVVRGTVSLKTATGRIEIGLPHGTAARLDATTKFGRVVNELDASAGPGKAEETADIHARTGFGDIVVRRA